MTGPSKYTYTGQYSDSYINLLWYGSRHYDPELGRFIQPDSIVPTSTQGVQAYDRYAYSNNNPVLYTDPSGHSIKPPPCWLCNKTYPYASSSGLFTHNGFINNALDLVLPGLVNLYPGGAYVNEARDTITFSGAEDYYPAMMANVVMVGADVVLPSNLYALGNTSGARPPRIDGYNLKPGQNPDILIDADGLVIPGQGGASTFETIEQLNDQGLSGYVWELPEGSSISGFDDVADGIPYGSQPPGHHSLVPNSRMLPDLLLDLFNRLPWRQVMGANEKPLKLPISQK